MFFILSSTIFIFPPQYCLVLSSTITTTFLLFSLHTTTTATTFLLFSLHHHHNRHHISIVCPPPPPPSPHFYCFPSTTTATIFLLFSLHHHISMFIGPLQQVKCGDIVLDFTTNFRETAILISFVHIFLPNSKCYQEWSSSRWNNLKIFTIKWFCQIISTVYVWGRCSIDLFEDIEKLHIKAARKIHDIPANICWSPGVKWHNLSYIYKKRIAFEIFKVLTSGLEHRLSSLFETYESSWKGLLMRMRWMNNEFDRQSLMFRGVAVWNGLNKSTRSTLAWWCNFTFELFK